MHNAILRYQDHWSVVCYLWKHPAKTSSPISPRSGRPLDWPMLHRQADALYRAHSNNNEFGLDNEKWDREIRQEMLRLRNTRSDEAFLRTLERNQEWVDLELLLRELTELGARPLLLSMPIHGGWYDQCGVTYTARRAYYEKLREIGARYHARGRRLRRSRCRSVLLPRSPWGTWLPVGWCITARSSTVFSTTRSHASPSSPPCTRGEPRTEAVRPAGPVHRTEFHDRLRAR